MLGEVEYCDDDWTSVIDDLDKYQLLENTTKLIPPSKLHRAKLEEDEGFVEGQESTDQYLLVVQIIPAYSGKELSVYADPDTLIQTGKKYTFQINEQIFEAIDVDESKCMQYRKDSNQIKLAINYKSNLESCDYDKYVQHLLDHISGAEEVLRFTNKNQFDFVYLCELFKLEHLKKHIMNYMSQNVDKNHVFEFLRVASLDPNNVEASREAYWMVVFIYLQRMLAIDISESFGSDKSQKMKQMLQEVDCSQFTFNQGFLECGGRKIDLNTFLGSAQEEIVKKEKTFETNNMHNLTQVMRSKSDMGVFHDYPHFYELQKEGSKEVLLYAKRESENSEFIISRQEGVFCKYGSNYLGLLKPNMLGTKFELFDFGLDSAFMKDLPKGFFARQRLIETIEYDSNFFAEKPRSFRIQHYDITKKEQVVTHKFENLAPKYNEARGCYTLNFFGRVSKASARNFQLCRSVEEDEDQEEEFLLSHGKCSKNNFNLDYREPFNSFNAFAVSLTAIGKKRVVG